MARDDAANANRLTIVLTGAESAGKTTLAEAIARALDVPWVPEFARSYLESRRGYDRDDLLSIAAGQQAAESAIAAREPLVVADTDLLVIRVWSAVKYGSVDARIDAAVRRQLAEARRFYLIPRPDIPWQPDRLREHPTSRDTLHRMHLDLLDELGLDHVELTGSHGERLATALTEIGRRADVTRRAR